MGLIQTVYVCTYLRPNFKEMHLYLICFLKTTTLHTQMIEGFSENSKRCNICQTLIVSVNSTKRCSNWHSKYVMHMIIGYTHLQVTRSEFICWSKSHEETMLKL